jgi:hypothetical protein
MGVGGFHRVIRAAAGTDRSAALKVREGTRAGVARAIVAGGAIVAVAEPGFVTAV